MCALTNSRELSHPLTSVITKDGPMDLVCTDLMARLMKEIFLLKTKSKAIQSIHAYNMAIAVPLGRRIECKRCDKGGEYVGQKFKTLCRYSSIQVGYTATKTPQHNAE